MISKLLKLTYNPDKSFRPLITFFFHRQVTNTNFSIWLQVEYTIPRNHGSDSPHVKKANIPMTKGGYLIYGTAHMHTGVVNSTLYGQVIFAGVSI